MILDVQSAPESVRRGLERASARYGGGDEMPLGGYVAIMGAFLGAAALVAGAARRQEQVRRDSVGSRLLRRGGSGGPEGRIGAADVALLGVATHKLTRIITKDWVTAPLRAPFTEYQGSAGFGEVKEKSRGRGLQRAVGDLVTCQFCTGPWVAGALVAGLLFVPRLTRTVAAGLAAVTVSDWLHLGYERLRR